jgi:hypothetical protein
MGKMKTAQIQQDREKPETQVAPAKSKWDHYDVVDSQTVREADYNEEKRVMEISFKSSRYRYESIPPAFWEDFKTCPSKGSFVQARIVGPDRKNNLIKGTLVSEVRGE